MACRLQSNGETMGRAQYATRCDAPTASFTRSNAWRMLFADLGWLILEMGAEGGAGQGGHPCLFQRIVLQVFAPRARALNVGEDVECAW